MKKEMAILKALKQYYPTIRIALNYSNTWELLVATILSAQCTDKRVNIIIKDLFRLYPLIENYVTMPLEQLEDAIRTAGLFRSKAKNIKITAERILEHYDGCVPDTMEDLLTLAGVARKTANIVLYNGYGKNEGIAIDTHVQRIVQLLGLTSFSDPKHIEQDMMNLYPRKEWGDLNHRLVQYGRDVCVARRPKCGECVLQKYCDNYQHKQG